MANGFSTVPKYGSKMIIKLKIYGLIFLLFLCISSCRNEGAYEKRTVFRYNESAGITSLDPAFAKDQANIWACNQLYNGLVQLDNHLRIQAC